MFGFFYFFPQVALYPLAVSVLSDRIGLGNPKTKRLKERQYRIKKSICSMHIDTKSHAKNKVHIVHADETQSNHVDGKTGYAQALSISQHINAPNDC